MSSNFPRPWDVGVRQGPKWEPLDERAVTRLVVSKSTRLTDLLSHFQFFTPAMVHSKAQILVDMYDAFASETGADRSQSSLRFERPIFKGFDIGSDPEWNYVLFALDKQSWLKYRAWLGTVAFTDMATGDLCRIRFLDIHVADPLFEGVAASLQDIPLVPVTVLCLETNKGSGVVLASRSKPWSPPVYRWMPQLRWRDTAQFALALQHELPDPYAEANTHEGRDFLPPGS